MHFLDVALLRTLWQRAFLVEKCHHSRLGVEQGELLRVVRICNVNLLQALTLVILLLELDQGIDELLLEALIGEIDA